ncbi:MAG: two pore domain potassium channel family protein [Bacteroidetes bacterium]|nr:two pore domain potassium channel family protein [Bacteroidota bacterium]
MDAEKIAELKKKLDTSLGDINKALTNKENNDALAVDTVMESAVNELVGNLEKVKEAINSSQPIPIPVVPQSEKKHTESKEPIIITRILAGIFILSGIACIFNGANWTKWISLAGVVLVDLYLLVVIYIAAILSDENKDRMATAKKLFFNKELLDILPTRINGLQQFFLMLLIVLTSFANIYFRESSHFIGVTMWSDSFLFSWGVISTITFGYSPQDYIGRGFFIIESVSAFILLLCALAFLISRLASFADKKTKG